ncbi:MAG: protein translocase subunit SecD [Akkermansia sp.]|nr:protein translocase subunit SecD [Akkermansia sp.]
MPQFLIDITASPFFYFCMGILLIVLFFWYLSAELDKAKRNAGTFFIVGLSGFCLLSLFVNGMQYGIDIKGGTELTLEVQPKLNDHGNLVPPSEEDMQQACNILEERLNSTGTSEVQILHSNNKILIQIPQQDAQNEARNQEKIEALVKMLTKMAKLELLAVYHDSERVIADEETQANIALYEERLAEYKKAVAAEVKGVRAPAMPRIPSRLGLNDFMILPYPRTDDETGAPVLYTEGERKGEQIIDYMVLQKPYAAMQKDVYITGKEVANAQPSYVHKGHVDVVLNRTGANRMGRLTGSMTIGRDRLAVVLNNQIKCAPVVKAVLHKEFNISGLNAKGEPEDISKALANPLSSDLKVEGRKNVSAQLGQSALEQGTVAGLIGMLGVFAFCYWYYRSAGIVAMFGLAFNALALLGLMSLFGFVLTLPGIAGIVLTMGMAVDANVLIYERMREEKALGRPFIICLRNAYEKAFSAIWDSNITSLITAVILFWLASGSIKGFAVTTSVGIVTSLIGAIVVTRVLFFWVEKIGMLKDFTFARAPFSGKVFDFMKYRKSTAIASLVLIVGCAVYGFCVRGEKALGIDFTGGATITYVVPGDSALDYSKVENTVMGMTLSKSPTVQEFSNATDRNIKIRCANKDDATKINALLRDTVPGMKELPAESVEDISSALGATFFKTACWALLAGLMGITFYLALRFEWSFAMGALISTAHDVVGIIGLVVLMGTELNIIHIGAFLTVAGYSINDTIVIYDRIREQLRLAEPNEDLKDIMNEAINTTLSRTLLTSGSTIAVLVALIALGGPAMRDFSITMLLGIFIGTYSSIFIASPCVLAFDKKHSLRRELQEADQGANSPA